MANAYFYSNIAVPTTLSGNINNSQGTCTATDTTGWPTSYPFIISIDFNTGNEELVKVTNNALGTLTIVRGFGGTPAVSHSSGAAIRHVLNAVDFTDFRTHEAATSGVHGVTGSFVGTTDTQTLTNKTLTAPAITNPAITGGGSLAGTFTGTPTFSGAVVFNGGPNISAGGTLAGSFAAGSATVTGAITFTGGPVFNTLSALHTRAATTDPAIRVRLDADSQSRLIIQADGKHVFGSGSATGDVDLYRSAAKILGSTSTFRVEPTDTTLDGYVANLPSSTAGNLTTLQVNGVTKAAMDANGGYTTYFSNTPSTYTPTWSGTGGATFSTNYGSYVKVGKWVFLHVNAQASGAGSGTSTVTVSLPSTPFRDGAGANTTRQTLLTYASAVTAGTNSSVSGSFTTLIAATGSGATTDATRGPTDITMRGDNIASTTNITIQGWYREA